jgi:AraC-like DNA-binding protein
MRRIWIYQALRLMQLINFDNTEIALLLNYSEEGSMVRDFRKELGYTPTKARKLLTNEKPEDMLKL